MDVTLTSTYHDADARLTYMFEDYIPKLCELYSDMSAVVSPLTHESARRRLTELGVNVCAARRTEGVVSTAKPWRRVFRAEESEFTTVTGTAFCTESPGTHWSSRRFFGEGLTVNA